MERLNARRDGAADLGEDAGFTLIELMVVLLILAILLAIAIPTFLGVTGGANDRAAQSNLNTALTTVKAAAANNGQTYSGIGITGAAPSFANSEPSLNWVNGSVTTQGPISVNIATSGNGVVLASWSKNNGGTCFWAADNQTALTAGDTGAAPYSGAGAQAIPSGAGTYYAEAQGQTSCDATANPAGLDVSKTAGVYWVSQTSLLK
jgi:type IV pilus assembly protein PilA